MKSGSNWSVRVVVVVVVVHLVDMSINYISLYKCMCVGVGIYV